MKKWIIVIALSACWVAVIPLLTINVTADRKVIHIRGGEPVLADQVSQSDQFVFYEVDGESGMFMKNDIASIGSIQVQKKTSLLTIIDQHKQQYLAGMGISDKLIRAANSRLLIFLAVLAVATGIMKLTLMIATVAGKDNPPASIGDAALSPTEKTGVCAPSCPVSSDLRDIAMFFLELYKLQSGLGKNAPSRFSMNAASSPRKMKIFELGVKGSNDWLTRRMSVGPLGEDTGSKSKCFYVIYDTHMVVKIPPIPVTDMVKYMQDIRQEVQIAANLAPIECIVPMISVVLKKVKTLPYESGLTPPQLEKQYIRLVEENPEYQEYLKIGDRFAFFMELANSFFLGHVIDALHESKGRIGDELREAPDVAWDQEAFTTRYGIDSLPVFEGLQSLYRLAEAEARRIVKESGQGENVHPFQVKNWFLTSVAGGDLKQQAKGPEKELLARIETGFATVFKTNQKNVDALTQLLKKHLETKSFLRNRRQIENITSNTLQLLCQLKEKRIALRDMKPDNLFLAADPDNYPVVLNNPENFSIGVIDVETAVSLVPLPDGSMAQPVLGGTPLYATPLHLLKNSTISAHFGNLAEALHFQDWFATIAIIFKAITGSNLFPKAARSFPEILKILKSGRSKSDPDEATVKAMSQKFWSAATADIKSHLTAFADVLTPLTLLVPERMVSPIKAELERESTCLNQAMSKHVSLSPLFKSDKNRAFLLEASQDTINKQVARWENAAHLPERHRKMAPQMAVFLNNLNRLKKGASEKHRAIAAISVPPHEVSAYSLIEAMFQIAYRNMYKHRWGAFSTSERVSDRQTAVREDQSLVTAVLSDN